MKIETKPNPRGEAPPPRRLPIGAEIVAGGVHFRLWAPKCKRVEVALDGGTTVLALAPEGGGYFAGISADARAGSLYQFRVDGNDAAYPDPASRYQPQGVHGPSQVVDAAAFRWSDAAWKGTPAHGQVLYELHIGTFTREGTYAAAEQQLESLRDLGVTCLEVMPLNEFAGRWGWGYDGVDQFAPYHHYGTPDELRRFVDRAHALGIGVILDLVYNHFGPDGNYLSKFSDTYFSSTHITDWGDALNFDGDGSSGVREFFLANIRYWIEEFHFDGYRFDATQAILDDSPRHILAEITAEAHRSAGGRNVYLINENEPQNTALVRPVDAGGYGMNGLWNDDFHHCAMVAVTGHNEAYYTDYHGTAQELLSCAKYGYLYQGQRYRWQKRRRGLPGLDLPATAFVHFLQNHDQIANTARGLRLHQITSPGELKAITTLTLLMPQTPMLFQGQEFAASTPFYYFADHNAELSKLIGIGRAKEIAQFPSAAVEEVQKILIDPGARETFDRCKLDHSQRDQPIHAEMYALHRELLRLRREERAFSRRHSRGDIDGAVVGENAFVIRFFSQDGDDRLLLVNLGRDLRADPAPEPLLAPPVGMRWSVMFSTDAPKYGGSGVAAPDTETEGWLLHGRCASVLRPLPAEQAVVETRHRVEGSAQQARGKHATE